ncbi:DNA polymerase alpha catalytic subunit-like [Rosa chinensis]|uniref:DNA polymerase alpha catalytic subunit-like n=1 Tax=Rosa chinensis TaxID=74649 RepID=UPI001AD8ACA0|nr:DNA polymerase alpha catalytic subunit-like [Rosa chinensis]
MGWKAAMTGGAELTGGSGNVEVKSDSISEGSSDFDLESDGSLPFYMLDAYEEFYGPNMGTVYLFGKVKVGSSYQSCCAVVKNMQRCVYAIPDSPLFQIDEMMKLEKDAEDSRISPTDFRKKLHDAASKLKNELAKKLLDLNVSAFSMAPVKRNYAFE